MINLIRGHGKFQAANSRANVVGFMQQGNKKKVANISIGQLRARFPQHAHLSEIELREIAKKEL